VKATGSAGIVGYQSIDSGRTFFGLPGQSPSTTSVLYSAQFASGGNGGARYFSDIVFINTSTQERNIQVLLVGNSGVPVTGILNPVSLSMAAGRQIRKRGEDLFGLDSSVKATTLVEGSLVITADGPGIIGDVTFGDPVGGKFLASLPLDGSPVVNFILSQVAEGGTGAGKPYFTGIAMFNPGTADAQVSLEVYSQNGEKTGSVTVMLPKGGRLSKTLPEYVKDLEQTGGYIRIRSDGQSIVAFELFGTQSLDFLAAVPPQPITP
jgi:hypothetical protein